MNTSIQIVSKEDQKNFKIKMLNWADRFNIFCFLDNNNYSASDPAFEWLLAAGAKKKISFTGDDDFRRLHDFHQRSPAWLFGHLAYHAAGNAYSNDPKADIDFGKGFFFEPEILLRLKGEELELLTAGQSMTEIFEQILATETATPVCTTAIFSSESREQYINSIQQLHRHIQRGDCYEMNFCRKFSAENATAEPVQLYQQLSELSPVPFAALYKLDQRYCICASPERFLQKKGQQLLSQPIKGTAPRDLHDRVKDEELRSSILQSEKEKSENVMIVDLVRNDLSIVCEKASVQVKELFGVYSFPRVHHLVSSIEGRLPAAMPFTEAIRACYPMGSMTGAPKKKVMELIEKYEGYDRGLFSGSIGYITPDADFDLNVVIRSIFIDKEKKKIVFFAGSGITFNSIPENEYDECGAKAEAMIKVLSAGNEDA